MKRHVSLVLIPIDDYTNQVINGNYLKPWIEWENEAIWKQGFYIFMDMKQEEVILHVESQLYQSQTIALKLNVKETRIIKLRLVPSEKYAKGNACIAISGKAKEGSKILFYSDEIRQSYKLLKDYEPGNPIGIFHPEAMDLSGKKIWIKGRDKSYPATLGERLEEEENCYEIEALSEKIRKVEADIFLAYEATVRENGTFYLLFPAGKEKEFHGIMKYGETSQQILLKAEEDNFFDLGNC